jgi:NADH dehydrogenase [ubiquinone] 1 alpha subcomplex assembly factor 6
LTIDDAPADPLCRPVLRQRRGRAVSATAAPGSHCALLVRARQPDRYLATLFAPAAAREALFALYAFDHEIGKVPHVVSQPMPGLIRLQWWRDALDAIAADRPLAHPVVQALYRAFTGFAVPRARLESAIDARERELEEPPPPTLAALEEHLEAVSGAITLAALAILGADDAAAHEAGRRVGLVVGIADLLRSLDADLSHGRLPPPAALLTQHDIALEPVPQAGPELAPVVATLAERGLAHLAAARAQRRAVPKAAQAALLPGTLAGAYLRRLRRTGHDPLAGPRQRSPLAPLSLLWRHASGRF